MGTDFVVNFSTSWHKLTQQSIYLFLKSYLKGLLTTTSVVVRHFWSLQEKLRFQHSFKIDWLERKVTSSTINITFSPFFLILCPIFTFSGLYLPKFTSDWFKSGWIAISRPLIFFILYSSFHKTHLFSYSSSIYLFTYLFLISTFLSLFPQITSLITIITHQLINLLIYNEYFIYLNIALISPRTRARNRGVPRQAGTR